MSKHLFYLAASAAILSQSLFGQSATPSCNVTAVPPLVRLEGVSERLGDIVLTCSGTPNQQVAGVFNVILNAPVTNRLLGTNLDVVVTQRTSAGVSPLPVSARLQASGQIVFENFRFQLDATGLNEIRISNIRADVSQSGSFLQDVFAQLAFNPPGLLNLTINRLSVGVVNRGLYATYLPQFVGNKIDTNVPELRFSAFLSGGRAVASTRITEGFNAAFEERGEGMSNGTRIIVRYAGLPSDARVFVPAMIAGSSALVRTAAGDFGGTPSGGEYVPGSNTLLLVRVLNADQNGAGGFVPFAPTSTDPMLLNELQELPPATGGAAQAVYEVVDSNPFVVESAQIPTFLGIPLSEFPRSLNITRTVSFGPISTAPSVSALAPVPRFALLAPPPDCELLRDCNQYRGRLVINSALLDWDVPQGLAYVRREVIFSNESNSRFMPWTARVEYKTGSGWVQLSQTYGFEPYALGVQIPLTNLQPGLYEATLVIDAGDAGIARIPIRVKLNPRTVEPPPPPAPTVTGVGNAATFTGALVPGSLGTITGTNLAGTGLQVTINGLPARVLFSNATQINLEVPSGLTGNTAQLVVTANGVASQAATVNLAASNPGIFPSGVLNQDYSVNSPTAPAATGSYAIVYATGLPANVRTEDVEVTIHAQRLRPSYAGPAPGFPGVQQINVQVPEGWPTMLTDIAVCTTANNQRICSPGARISLRQAQ